MTNETIRQDTTIMYQIAYPRTKTTSRAFTRLDLVMAIAALFVLGIIALPLLANNDRASERAVCWNNLRMVGRGVQTWASDRNGLPPWGVPTTAGGTYIASKSGSAYLEYAWMSNELVTPKILACPTDFGVKVERDWGAFRFISGSSALSYNLGLESGRGGGLDWISSDRNVRFDGNASSCTLGIVNAELISVSSSSGLQWLDGASHGEFGHFLFLDGSVKFTSTAELRVLILKPGNEENGNTHALRAR